MKKLNPFYQYLSKYQRSLIQQKTDSFDNHFLLITLNSSPVDWKFDYNDEEFAFIEHHITIYEHIDDEVGFKSTLHYTIRFDSLKFHLYFDENGAHFLATIEKNNQFTLVDQLVDDTNDTLTPIKMLVEKHVQPSIQPLFAEHLSMINVLETQYIQEITNLKTRLFDASEEIKNNIRMIQKVIAHGEQLLKITHKQSFVKDTLRYLNRCQETLAQSQTLKSNTKILKMSAANEETVIELAAASLAHGHLATKKHKKIAKTPTILPITATEKAEFQAVYNIYVANWAEFESSTYVAKQVELFENIGANLLSKLHAAALIVLTFLDDSTAPEDQLLCRQADLDVNLFQQAYQKAGISLLTNCLKEIVLLDRFGDKLKQFTKLLPNSCLESAIRQQDVAVLRFLLEHGSFNINQYLIKFKKGPALSPLCAAYKYNDIELFEALLINRASCMALYEDLPLAHILLQKSSSDPFQVALFRYYAPILDANPRFYKALSVAVNHKLQSMDLNATQALQFAKNEYAEKGQVNLGQKVRLSESVRSDVASIREAMNPTTIQELRDQSPEMLDLRQQLNEKSVELLKLLRKTHKITQLEQVCKIYYNNAKKLIDDGYGYMYHGLTKEQVIESMKRQIICVQASIDYSKLHTKTHLTKVEKRTMIDAVGVLKEQNEQFQLLETQQKSLDLIHKFTTKLNVNNEFNSNGEESLDQIISKIQLLISSLGSLCVDEDADLKGLDFVTSAGLDQPKDLKHNLPNTNIEDQYFIDHPMVDSNPTCMKFRQEDLTQALVPYNPTLFATTTLPTAAIEVLEAEGLTL